MSDAPTRPAVPDAPLAAPASQSAPLLKVMVWGEPGCGKSRFGLSSPAPLVADLERSTGLYAAEFGHWVAEPQPGMKRHQLVYALVKQIQRGDYTHRQTLVIDPMTDYVDALEAAIVEKMAAKGVDLANMSGLAKSKAYADLNDIMREQLDDLLKLPLNIVMVCRAKNIWDKGPDGRMQPVGRQPDIKGIVPYLADVVLKIERDGTAIVEKSRLGALPSRIPAASFADLTKALADARGAQPVTLDVAAAPAVVAAPATKEQKSAIKSHQARLGWEDADLFTFSASHDMPRQLRGLTLEQADQLTILLSDIPTPAATAA